MSFEAVDNCPERMDAVDAEAPRLSRIETAVEFWSGMGVKTASEVERARKKKQKQQQGATGEC